MGRPSPFHRRPHRRPFLVALMGDSQRRKRVREGRPPADLGNGSGGVRWASLVALVVAAGTLLGGLVLAGTYTFTHPGTPCTNPPQLEGSPTQWVVVGLGVGGFVLGHLTARFQLVDPHTISRHPRPGEEPKVLPQDDPRKRDGLIVQGLLLVFLAEVIGLLVIEITTISNHVWPITFYVRCAYNANGRWSTAVAVAIMFLVGRWFWLAPRRRPRVGAGS